MNIQAYMDEASLTAEFAVDAHITKGKILKDAELYKVNFAGKDIEKVRFRMVFVGDDPAGTMHEYRLYWYPKPRDFLVLGTVWGNDTKTWVNKNIGVLAWETGRVCRIKVWPLVEAKA